MLSKIERATSNDRFIIGAGVSGLALALLLSKKGHRVSIYEKRLKLDKEIGGKSINLTISGRGFNVFNDLGLKDEILSHAVIVKGRKVHFSEYKSVSYKYGTQNDHVLYAIRRAHLINILLEAVEKEAKISTFYGVELLGINQLTLTCSFRRVVDNVSFTEQADSIIGADGVFSTVRNVMLSNQLISYQQHVFDWGYKEFHFDRNEGARLNLNLDHIHVWSKSNSMLVAIPNTNHTFSAILLAPRKNKDGKLNDFNMLVKTEYRELGLNDNFFMADSGRYHNCLVSIKIDKWHLEDKIVLIGDACHATYPFYGQGMNSALEDAVVLNNFINKSTLSRSEAFSAYEELRKAETSILHQLSETHLNKMAKSMSSSFGQAKDILDFYMAKYIGKWLYEYEAVAHSKMSYLHIHEKIKRQRRQKLFSGLTLVAFVLGIMIELKRFLAPWLSNPNKSTTIE